MHFRYTYFSVLPLHVYDKVCFSTSNDMNRPSHYFNSPINLQLRHQTDFLRILFSHAHFREI